MEKLLVDKEYLLQKIPGKGGWTYALIPEIMPDKKAPFGWVKVKGSIDGFNIQQYHLMPFGKGQLFLPVKASIRKQIKKQAGDLVHVILYEDNEALQIPDELMVCLQDEPDAFHFFVSLNQTEQASYINWIYTAKKEQTKIERIASAIHKLSKKEKFRTE